MHGFGEMLNFVQARFNGETWIQTAKGQVVEFTLYFVENMFNSTEFKKMYAPDSGVKFDIFLTEYLYGPAVLGIAHRFNVPIIGISLIHIHGSSRL